MTSGTNPTLKLLKRERLRLVHQCIIDRKTEVDTQVYIYQKTGNKITTRTIRRDKRQLKDDATTFFFLLAKDNDEYNHKLQITIDSLEETLSDLKREYKQTMYLPTKLKIAEQLLKYEKEVYEYYKFLPMLGSQLSQSQSQNNENESDELDEPIV